jgi:hypothetical protein
LAYWWNATKLFSHLVAIINPFSAGLFLSYIAEPNFPKWFLTCTRSPSGWQPRETIFFLVTYNVSFWPHTMCRLVLEPKYRWRRHSTML